MPRAREELLEEESDDATEEGKKVGSKSWRSWSCQKLDAASQRAWWWPGGCCSGSQEVRAADGHARRDAVPRFLTLSNDVESSGGPRDSGPWMSRGS